MPTLSDRKPYEQWVDNGALPIEKVANAKWKKILADYEEPALPADVDADLRRYMENL